MTRIMKATVFLFASLAFVLLPTDTNLLPRPALAASGATFAFPANHIFESGPKSVGSGPTNYDFSSGGTGWTKTGGGSVTYSGGIATLSGGLQLRSSSYALSNPVQAVKIRYKYVAATSASVNVNIYVGGTSYGGDNLACPVGCTDGQWTEKYIGFSESAQGQTVTVRITQTGATTTEVDYLGEQWLSLQEWRGPTGGGGVKSQPEFTNSQYAEVHGTLRTRDFVLLENRLEFDYSFPLATGNSLTAYLHRASDNVPLTSKVLSGNAIGWTRVTDWTWVPADFTGQTVYVRFVSDSNSGWVDNVGINLGESLSLDGYPSAFAGDPFNTSTPQSIHSHTDILIPGKGIPLEFTRYYNSMAGTPGPLGYNWRHTYSTSIRVDSDESVTVSYATGGGAYFKFNAGSFTAPAGVYDTLVRTGTPPYTYTLTTKSQIRYEFTGATPVLTAIKDRNNNTTSLTYTGGVLTTVTDASTLRSLTFTYDGSNRIFRVTDPLTPNTRTVEFTYDTNGDLWKVKDVKGDPTSGPFTVYTYSNHRMTSLTDSNGHLQNTNVYDGANRVVDQTDATGGKTCSYYGTPPTYASAACPGVSPAPAAGQTVVVSPRVLKTTYDFDTKFRTTGITDHNGGVTTLTYDNNDRTSSTNPLLKVWSYTYDSKGNVLTDTNPLRQPSGPAESGAQCGTLGTGNATDDDGDTKVDDGCPSGKYEYTANNDLDVETDALGRQTDYIYDSSGNLTRIARKDSGGAVKALTCFERDAFGQVTGSVQSTTLTIPPGATDPCTGNKTVLGYDTYGNMTCTVNARFTGSTTCASDPGKKASFIFDAGGRLLYSTNEITNNSKPVRGSMPEIGSQCGTDGNGNGVDDDDNPSDDSVIDDGCPSTKYVYDAQNNVLTVTDGLGNVTTSAYDGKGNQISVRDANRKTAGATAESGTAQCSTDGTGDGENDDPADDTVIDDGCLSVVYRYDNVDRLEKVIQAAVSTTSIPTTTYGYDGNGNRTSVTNPRRQPVGPTETGIQCGTGGTGNDVDEDGDGTKDDGCASTKYAFDNLDRLQSATGAIDYLSRVAVTSYQYDAASNLTQRTDARNLVTKYFPDDMNRLDLIEHWSGTTLVDSVDYTYNAVGFRTQMKDNTSPDPTVYTPDALDRIVSVTFPGPKTVSYTYDDAPGEAASEYPGQRTKITYPDSKYVDYAYLADGRMSTVTDWLTKQTAYTHDDAGRLTKTQLPNGAFAHNRYDAADRLVCVVNDKTASAPSTCASGTAISKFEYTLDSTGNRTQMVDLGGTHTYLYDSLYRLSQATYPGPQTDTYSYDANGNRLTKNATSYNYDAADQMTSTGGVNYGYDNDGNQTGRGSDTFTFDHENRLTKIVLPNTPNPEEPCYDLNGSGFVDTGDTAEITGQFGGTDAFYDLNASGFVDTGDTALVNGQFGKACVSRFIYNGDGLRTARAGSHLNWKYVWDVAAGLPVVLKETDSHNATDGHGADNTYVYGLDLISVTDRTGNQSYFLYDALGSTGNLTDGGGNTAATYSYDVFGELRPPSTPGTEWLFTGEQRDRQGGRNFYYLRARYYDPAIGRFLSQDPLPGGNLYPYVESNPVNLLDPSGLCPSSCEGGFASPCRIPFNCWSINYGKILEALPDYLACVAFGVALAAFLLENPWLAAAAIGIDVAASVVFEEGGAAESAAVGGGAAAGEKWLERAAKTWKPKGMRWDEIGIKGFGKTLSAFALGYSGWGCAQKVGILEVAGDAAGV